MKIKSLVIIVTSCFILALGSILATAATYKSFHCGCTTTPGNYCICDDYSYRLSPSETKEFRGYCDGTNVGDNYGVGNKHIYVTGDASGTTCTISANLIAPYITKSCTNWSPFSGDRVYIKIRCDQH